MLLDVIKYNKAAGDCDLENNRMFNTAVKDFFQAEDVKYRMVYLLSAQFYKLSEMVKLGTEGKDCGIDDLSFPNKDVIDLMINAVQSELKNEYVRVITAVEPVVCEFITDDLIPIKDTVAKISNVIKSFEEEFEEDGSI